MHNPNYPDDLLLNPQSLRRSGFGALAVALLLLLVAVLPAEFAIDPTGIGRLLGLTHMGEIKRGLAQSAQESALAARLPAVSLPSSMPHQQHAMTLVLPPNSGTEVKMDMPRGARVQFHWRASGGALYFDTHGDPYGASQDFYHGYGKGRDIAQQSGELVAAFDGRHGWYWRNSGSTPVTLTLRTEGEYLSIEQLL